ncbi:MAG: dihydroxyacetone kinase subunit DhaK [Deltaproteobacteria bacterium]|jgi:phosphoenolpyruvate---glycerone phosphotransferase subunit DhaK|nr:dihydroxyacetone kinase subunit DhaK [Deltaproteobacteria bacterium]MBT4643822.1 dihydroxyacetone kinase subunit DhaK [Deltaproteobacteria bacterium]
MRMSKKILNDPKMVVEELLEGLVSAGHGSVRKIDGFNILVRSEIEPNKVGLLIGGGSGHEPLFPGFVGKNLADGSACGNVFTAPPPNLILEATRSVDGGKGVLYLYGNYTGDNMNFDIGMEMAKDENIDIKTIRVWDDVASAPLDKIQERRGIAGDLFMIKIAGAATNAHETLDEVYNVTSKARDWTRSMGVALSSGSIPETGEYNFELPADELEIGMGLHGEFGVFRKKMMQADQLVDEMVELILNDLPYKKGDEVAVLINNLGATTMMELLVVNRRVHHLLKEKGITIYDTLIGSYCTSQEMAGCSITLMKLDDELKRLYDYPTESFALSKLDKR